MNSSVQCKCPVDLYSSSDGYISWINILPPCTYAASTDRNTSGASLPNIIFILADDLGYGDVQYNGGDAVTSNLNAMASGPHSIKFTRFYSGGPVCSPTRGTLLTGRNHNRYCIWRANTAGKTCNNTSDFNCAAKMPLPTSEITVAEILKNAGYRTATFGKWHLGDLKPLPGGSSRWPSSHPGQHGFDVWKVTERSVPTANPNCACFNTSLCVLGHSARKGPPSCTNYHAGTGSDMNTLVTHDEPIIGDDSHFIVDEFASFLNSTVSNTDTPFFAYISLHTVHKVYVAIPPYSTLYTSQRYSQKEVDYYGAITAMDKAIGKIRELLGYHNLTNNTMLWFTSDNGPENNTPGQTAGLKGRKGSLYEGGIRVPGILEWPAVIPRNQVSNFPVVTSDFLPTICDILGTQPPKDRQIDGISILPHIQGNMEYRTKPITWAFNKKGDFRKKYSTAISDNRYKAHIEYKNGKVRSSHLYDLLIDSAESRDLSSQHPAVLRRLTQVMDAWTTSLINSARNEVSCLATPV